ncbi:hypothetical protein C8J57DRAFT_1483475 [Mycena rebaudengoi]|nr:hypothetical protein C8J57DRAFT_1483475 [Mycena rebaudengoi]
MYDEDISSKKTSAGLLSESIEDIIKRVGVIIDNDLQFDIDHLQKTHLLRNRREFVDNAPAQVTQKRRHYLTMAPIPAHRKALTRLTVSDHNLSVERLRYPARYRQAIPRDKRLCHFCLVAVEDEVHAMLDCEAYTPLVLMGRECLADIFADDPALGPAYGLLTRYEFLRRMIASRKAVTRVAKYVHDVFALFDRFQRFIPAGYHT